MPSGMRRCVKMVSQPPSSLMRIRGQTRHGSNSISDFDPFRYKYTFESQGAGPGAVSPSGHRRSGCDGVYSTFERMGTLNADGEVRGPRASSLTRVE